MTDTPTRRDLAVTGAPGRPLRKRPVRASVTQTPGTSFDKAQPIDEGPKEWRRRLQELFGPLSPEFVETSMRQLLRVAVLPNETEASSVSLSAALALVSSLAPEDEAQAALAVHIACLHMASIRMLGRSHHCSERHVVAMGAVAAKLERAFQSALETYYRLRRGGTQIVRVERVEVQAGAQAIVGVVTKY